MKSNKYRPGQFEWYLTTCITAEKFVDFKYNQRPIFNLHKNDSDKSFNLIFSYMGL